MKLNRSLSAVSLVLVLLLGACSSPVDAGLSNGLPGSRAVSTTVTTGSVQLAYLVTNDWGNGYTASWTLTNLSNAPINGWELEWATTSKLVVEDCWSAAYTSLTSSNRAVPVAYNVSIPAKGSINFGFKGAGASLGSTPTWIKFNGVLIGGSTTVTTTVPPPTTTTTVPTVASTRPADVYGQLKVVRNRITDSKGNVVQLRGVSSAGLQWHPFVPGQTVKNLVSTFKIEVLRAAMYVRELGATDGIAYGYLGINPEVKDNLVAVVGDAIDAGIYVIVDWHIHWNPNRTASSYTPEAVQFFKEMGQKLYKGKALKDYPNVIWEVMNEPGDQIAWSQVKAHAAPIIQQIRVGNQDPDNLILVPATNWAQNLDTVAWDGASDRPDRLTSNVAYTLHFYTSSHGAELRAKAQVALDAGLSVFADEWGNADYNGSGQPNLAASQAWMDWMNANKISWASWSACDKAETTALLAPGSGMIGPWSTAQLSTSGKWVQNWISLKN